VLETIAAIKAPPHGGFQHGPGHDNHGGPNDWDHHGNDWDRHPYQPPYNGPVNECSDWTFKSDTPNPFTNEIYFYDYQGQIHDQKVTVNIGARDLEPWESETITVCPGFLSTDKSLFNYSVTRKDTSGFGSFFTGTKSYEYTLVPTGRKSYTPDANGLSMVSGGATPAGKVAITIADKWSQMYQGQQIVLTAKVMRIPSDVQNLPPQELLNALKETTVTAGFAVAPQYAMTLFDSVLSGTYTVTVTYLRDGQLLNQMFYFTRPPDPVRNGRGLDNGLP
jgi:hypothetical protein